MVWITSLFWIGRIFLGVLFQKKDVLESLLTRIIGLGVCRCHIEVHVLPIDRPRGEWNRGDFIRMWFMIPSEDVPNGISVKVVLKRSVVATLSSLSVTNEHLGIAFKQKSKTGLPTKRRLGIYLAMALHNKLITYRDGKRAAAVLPRIKNYH